MQNEHNWLNNNNEQERLTTTSNTISNKLTKPTTKLNTNFSLNKQTIMPDNENELSLLSSTKTPTSLLSNNLPKIIEASDTTTTDKSINQNLLTRLINLRYEF